MTEAELAELIWQRFGNRRRLSSPVSGDIWVPRSARAGHLAEAAGLTGIPTSASVARWIGSPIAE